VSGREVYIGNTLEGDLALEGDVTIIGSGAGGAISAEILAHAGLRVLIVEEGAYRTPQDFIPREIAAFSQLYFEGGVRQTRDGGIGVVQGRTVGGSTTVNWTSSFRTPDPTLLYWRDHLGIDGLAPADLDPWFAKIEQRLHIAPWESPNVNNQLLARGAERLGWRYGAIRRNVHNCANLGFCGLGCPIGAKQSMDVTAIPEALDHGAALVTRVRAETLTLSADRVTSVECNALDEHGVRPTGRRVTLRAPWVIVAAAAINTPALLMQSKVPDPYRLVGKRTFLQTHNYSLAFMAEPVHPFYGVQQSVYTDQFTWRDGVEGRAGFNMEVAGAQPVVSMNTWKGIGAEMAAFARRLPHLHTLVSQIRDGFHPDSPGGTVRLSDDGRAVLDYPLNDFFWDGVRSSYLAMAECQFAAGAESVHPACSDAKAYQSWPEARSKIATLRLRSPNVYLNSTHPLGGCPMGRDPRASVVDPYGRHHHVANLAVIDGSILPTSLGVNPSLTLFALAARNASALVQRIRS
jgi:choline dehydrogenase-like flavoprotein